MNINREIGRFLQVAAAAWRPLFEGFETGGEGHDLACDWLQFHWELLVEQSLCSRGHDVRLETYGNGAETEDGRVYPAAGPLFQVYCTAKNNTKIRDLFSGEIIGVKDDSFPVQFFAQAGQGFFVEEPPFNCVFIYSSQEEDSLFLNIADLDFFVKEDC